jgi:hypothetical protein
MAQSGNKWPESAIKLVVEPVDPGQGIGAAAEPVTGSHQGGQKHVFTGSHHGNHHHFLEFARISQPKRKAVVALPGIEPGFED